MLKFNELLPKQFRPAEACQFPIRFIGFSDHNRHNRGCNELCMHCPQYVKLDPSGIIWFTSPSQSNFTTRIGIGMQTVGYHSFVCMFDAKDEEGATDTTHKDIDDLKKEMADLRNLVILLYSQVKELTGPRAVPTEGIPDEPGRPVTKNSDWTLICPLYIAGDMASTALKAVLIAALVAMLILLIVIIMTGISITKSISTATSGVGHTER
jgi:hypothetical protein